MFRIFLLAALAPLVIACQTSPTVYDNQANTGEAISEPTDGIENEITPE